MQLKSNLIAILPMTALLGFAAGCGTAGGSEPTDPVETPNSTVPTPRVGDQADNTANNPLLTLDIEPGHSITYYEPAAGFLIVVESNAARHKSVTGNLDSPDAIEVFKLVRPAEEVPGILLQAVERARSALVAAGMPVGHTVGASPNSDAPPAMRSAPAAPASGDGIGAITQAHSQANPQDFVANHGGCNWGPIWSICRVNWGGGFHSGTVNANSGVGVLDHFAGGGVNVRLGAGAVSATFFQGPGTLQVYTWGIAAGFIPRFFEVFNAAGDSFHAGARFN